jgi:hypothetical protein
MRILLAAFAASTMLAATAIAADEAPSYEKGPVWDFGQIQTKDGHFDEYMKWVSTAWKAQEEAMKKAGYIVDYKVYLVQGQRSGEPDIILATEYKDMAVFDHPVAEEYAMQAKISGSIVKADQEQAARGSIRTVLGDIVMREAVLK